MNRRRRAVLAASLVMLTLGGVGYGCSDDKPPANGSSSGSTSGTASNDSGGSKDTATQDTNNPVDTGIDSPKFTAKAILDASSDASTVTGSVTFTEENGSVTAVVTITSGGFPPGDAGLHGIHIHQNASCAANDSGVDGATVFAGGAGGHWNPLDASHGYPDAASHHLGDMGNILIDGTGKGTLTLVSKDWTVQPGSKSVVGHAVVFHAGTDDGVSQPVGDAGSRPGCGVIILQ